MRSKSYWQRMGCRTERDKIALKSWFSPLCDDMTPESAEVLCDKVTDREKKLRVVMVDGEGDKRIFTRTFGGKSCRIAIKMMKPAAPSRASGTERAPAPVKALPPAHAEPEGSA